MKKKLTIGVFGGTFDPPHIGHLLLADEAQAQFKLDRVLWVLTPFPPHKNDVNITPLSIRMELVLAAIYDSPSFEFCSVDIDRPAPTYAVDTMRILRDSYPSAKFMYLMGADSLRNLPQWHQPEVFLKYCDSLGIMKRFGNQAYLNELTAVFPDIAEKINLIDVPLIQISSSDIRKRVSDSRPYRYFLPDKVYQVMCKFSLYQQP